LLSDHIAEPLRIEVRLRCSAHATDTLMASVNPGTLFTCGQSVSSLPGADVPV